jgi:hypothetical protein
VRVVGKQQKHDVIGVLEARVLARDNLFHDPDGHAATSLIRATAPQRKPFCKCNHRNRFICSLARKPMSDVFQHGRDAMLSRHESRCVGPALAHQRPEALRAKDMIVNQGLSADEVSRNLGHTLVTCSYGSRAKAASDAQRVVDVLEGRPVPDGSEDVETKTALGNQAGDCESEVRR